MSDVNVYISGKKFTGFKSVQLRKSLTELCGTFAFEITDENIDPGKTWKIKPGQIVVIYYGKNRFMTGYIETMSPSLSNNERKISVEGREVTCDLIDCSAEVKTYQKQKLLEFCNSISKPFRYGKTFFDVRGVKDVVIGDVVIEPGQSVFEVIDRQLRKLAYIPITDTYGNVLLTTTNRIRLGIPLVEGQNIKTISVSHNITDIYSEYEVVGQDDLDIDIPPDTSTTADGIAKDKRVRRNRKLITIAEDAVDIENAEKRAQYEAMIRRAKSMKINVSVQDWVDTKDRLLKINRVTQVISPSVGVNGYFLTESIEYKQDSGGTEASITLVDARTFIPEPEKEENDEDDLGI